jgi:regulator of replication initiation timing
MTNYIDADARRIERIVREQIAEIERLRKRRDELLEENRRLKERVAPISTPTSKGE